MMHHVKRWTLQVMTILRFLFDILELFAGLKWHLIYWNWSRHAKLTLLEIKIENSYSFLYYFLNVSSVSKKADSHKVPFNVLYHNYTFSQTCRNLKRVGLSLKSFFHIDILKKNSRHVNNISKFWNILYIKTELAKCVPVWGFSKSRIHHEYLLFWFPKFIILRLNS